MTQHKNQVIEGRTGTGKTHVLGTIYEYYRHPLEENKVLPIYVNISKIYDEQYKRSKSEEMLVNTYRGIVEDVIQSMKEFTDDKITVSYLQRFFNTKQNEKRENIRENVAQLKQILKGEPEGGEKIFYTSLLMF